MTARITLREVAEYTRRKAVFNCNESLWSVRTSDAYVVYSYGAHFPVAAFSFALEGWFVNSSKYSNTTSRHQAMVRGGVGSNPHMVDTEQLHQVLYANFDERELMERTGDDLREAAARAPIVSVLRGLREGNYQAQYA